MQKYNEILAQSAVPQTQPLNAVQVPNSAGGFAYMVDHWTQLDRFLMLGTVGGTFYAGERDLTKQNFDAILKCIAEDGSRTVKRIEEVSDKGMALKNDPSLFALALCIKHGTSQTRTEALSIINRVARIPTHLFHLLSYTQMLEVGWGRSFRNAVAKWYSSKPALQLAKLVTKYQGRDGWTNKDVLRLAHPKPSSSEHGHLYARIMEKLDKHPEFSLDPEYRDYLTNIDRMKSSELSVNAKAAIIAVNRLPREVLPTYLLTEKIIWEALAEDMPLTALTRNLNKLTEVGLIGPMSRWNKHIAEKLIDAEQLKKARVHPMQLLITLRQYSQGHGLRGHKTWTPEPDIMKALGESIEQAYGTINPSGKRILYALDVSGSMNAPAGDTNMTCFYAGAALGHIVCNTEPESMMISFDTDARRLNVRGRRLDNFVNGVQGGGGTDLSQPFLWLHEKHLPVDLVVIFTDSETWAGNQHPEVALKAYVKKVGVTPKVVIVSGVANCYSGLGPKEPNVLQVVGFDGTAPQVISAWATAD